MPHEGKKDKSIKISWTSSRPAIISNEGKVTRPKHADAHVILTARLEKDGVEKTKDFRLCVKASGTPIYQRPRVIVTTDGEEDDMASMVRFLLTCNDFDVEAIINSLPLKSPFLRDIVQIQYLVNFLNHVPKSFHCSFEVIGRCRQKHVHSIPHHTLIKVAAQTVI